jgi:hypothetical protein
MSKGTILPSLFMIVGTMIVFAACAEADFFFWGISGAGGALRCLNVFNKCDPLEATNEFFLLAHSTLGTPTKKGVDKC